MFASHLDDLKKHGGAKLLACKTNGLMGQLNLKPKQLWLIGSLVGGACFAGLLLFMLFVALVLSAGGTQPGNQPMLQHAPDHQAFVPARPDNFWSTQHSAGNCNADNTQGYVNVPGHGVVGYGF